MEGNSVVTRIVFAHNGVVKFTRYCIRAIVFVGFALFLISVLFAIVNLADGTISSVLDSLRFVTEAGLLLGIGLIAEILLQNGSRRSHCCSWEKTFT